MSLSSAEGAASGRNTCQWTLISSLKFQVSNFNIDSESTTQVHTGIIWNSSLDILIHWLAWSFLPVVHNHDTSRSGWILWKGLQLWIRISTTLLRELDKYAISQSLAKDIYSFNSKIGCKLFRQWRKALYHYLRRQSGLQRPRTLNMNYSSESSGKLFESLTTQFYPSFPCSISSRFWYVSFFLWQRIRPLLIILQDRSNIGEKYLLLRGIKT